MQPSSSSPSSRVGLSSETVSKPTGGFRTPPPTMQGNRQAFRLLVSNMRRGNDENEDRSVFCLGSPVLASSLLVMGNNENYLFGFFLQLSSHSVVQIELAVLLALETPKKTFVELSDSVFSQDLSTVASQPPLEFQLSRRHVSLVFVSGQ